MVSLRYDKDIASKLQSLDQRDVALGLSDMYIRQEPNNFVAQSLKQVRDIIWNDQVLGKNYEEDLAKRTSNKERIKEIVDSAPSAEDKKALADAYVRLGHLYEIAGHEARENFLVKRLKRRMEMEKKGETLTANDMAPGGVFQLLFTDFKDKKIDEAVEALSTPVAEYVFTQHPTNTNQLGFMQLQRELAHQLEKVVHGDRKAWGGLADAMAKFHHEEITKDTNFTTFDETNITVNFLSNAFSDLDRVYGAAERALASKYKDGYSEDLRQKLDLKFRFGSWGSAGDKDGNGHIKAENTLEAIVMHKLDAAKLYHEQISKMKVLPNELKGWMDKFASAAQDYQAVLSEIEGFRKENDIALSKEQFDALSTRTKAISETLGKVDDFIGDTNIAADHKGSPAIREQLLSLNRKARVFGFNLGKIEYRETAEEYGRAIKHLSGFQGNAQERAASFMSAAHGEELRNYKDKQMGDAAITYHTLKRMELARDFDDMITHNVLAECKRTEDLQNALELQKAVKKDGKRALLHIVPLFEEAETMANIKKVIAEALTDNVYHDHLQTLRARDGTARIVQQVQIAHSDNARRAGAIASRGIIHQGHADAREAQDDYNKTHDIKVDVQMFEGGSQSDSYRNGVRPVTAMVRDFNLKDFAKMTFQGGDLPNYFNVAASTERLLLRTLVQQCQQRHNGHGLNAENAKKDKAVISALSKLQLHYDVNIYDHPSNLLGKLLHLVGYRKQTKAGSAGTRGARNTPEEEAKIAAQEAQFGVDAQNIRTIGFSEALQHAGIHPTFIGAGNLREYVEREFRKEKLNDPDWQALYADSPAFKDVIDKLSYSIINSDLRETGMNINRTRPAADVLNFANVTLPNEYLNAAKLVYEAKTGKAFVGQDAIAQSQTDVQREMMRINHYQTRTSTQSDHILDAADRMKFMIQTMDNMKHFRELNFKHRYVDGLKQMQEAGVGERMLHNARDTLYHGRTFRADDSSYSIGLNWEREQESKRRAA